MSFKRKKINGGIEGLKKRIKTPGTVDVGIIDAGKHKSGDMTVAEIATTHEYGAEIDHPGGTPYKISKEGKAIFVKKGTPGIAGVTKPHKIKIPERSFMRSTLHKESKKISILQKKLLKQISKGEITTTTALGLLGEFVSDKIKQKIVSISDPPNKPSTIRSKGSSNPLIDTGQMKNSVTYEVNR